MPEQDTVQIYVYLIGEGVDVWRPVEAVRVNENKYKIVSKPSDDGEVWQFSSGDIVECQERQSENHTYLVAYARASQ